MIHYLGTNLLLPENYLLFCAVFSGILLFIQGYKNEIPSTYKNLSEVNIYKWKKNNKKLCYIEGICFVFEGMMGKFARDNLITAIVMTIVGILMMFCIFYKFKNNRKYIGKK